MSYRFPTLSAGFFGFTGVALGAFGAHGLRDVLAQQGTQHAWETAVHYQLIHALALLGAAIWLQLPSAGVAKARIGWAAVAWIAGIFLFSGSLYGLALGGPRFLGPITPLGGVAFLLGWSCVIAAALKREPPAQS
jgi:uncharacterized membrane protein YgdD (TMEM256/DUF423 family)